MTAQAPEDMPMKTTTSSRPLAACGGVLFALFALFAAFGARADDTEIFFNQSIGNVPANILFILDTSGSMNDTVTTTFAYDPKKTYKSDTCGSIDSTSYYFSTVGGKGGGKTSNTPKCGSTNKLPISLFKCQSMLVDINSPKGSSAPTLIQWGKTGKNYLWQAGISASNTTGYVECQGDNGIDGDGVDKTKLYPSKAPDPAITTGIWDATPANSYFSTGAGKQFVIYSPNYVNYLLDSTQTTTQAKIAVMRAAASNMLSTLKGVSVGLARYDFGANGGMILAPVADIDAGTNRQDRIDLVNSWAADGYTPLSETYFEAYQYFAGGPVTYGNGSSSTLCLTWSVSNGSCTSDKSFAAPSVASSRTGGVAGAKTYDSPADYTCRKNFIVYLTDGLPTKDTGANAAIQALPDFAKLGGSCDAPTGGNSDGICTGALAQYMYNADLRPDVGKVQNVTSYFIGFGADFTSNGAPTAAFSFLQNAAQRGGGSAYTADSLVGLTDVFTQILAEVDKTNTTFTAPAVAVNAFNRTQTLNDLYVSVFSPRTTYHWPGNIKKYKLVGGAVTDANGLPAVNASTGFFLDSAQSFWSSVADGADVTVGGAASKLPDPAKRTIYTTMAPGVTGTSFPSLIPLKDSSLKVTDFNLGATGDPTQTDLVNWAYGLDVQNVVGVPNTTTDARHEMGDPIHTQPVVVIYGPNSDGSDNTVIFGPTNDGYFHAIDGSMAPVTGADVATSGQELWSFIPNELLPHIKDLYGNAENPVKHYGLDGQISVLKYDVNGDGIINGDDRVILFFGTGRNADVSAYYALEVTDKTHPKLLWKVDGKTLTGLGQAWSTPTITRVKVGDGSSQNSQRLVLVIGGGYDPLEDNKTYYTADGVGNAVYMVDALYGTPLWSASSSGATLNLAKMDHAIPAQISALDLDGDGYADRLYVGDMAAQVWRFDISNGQPAATLATGGVIASLGTHEDTVHALADERRFYSPADVSAEQKSGISSFINVALGSGYRGHPLDLSVHDRFYSVRDYNGYVNQTQTWFNNYVPARDAVSGGPTATLLVDITSSAKPTVPDGSPGWQLDLNTHPNWSAGEKSLSPSRTFNGQVIFTTYSPTLTVSTDPCAGVGTGTNRVYVVDVFTGAPVIDRNKDGSLTTDERSQDLRQGGIAPEAAFLFPAPDTGSSGSGGNGGGGGAGSGTVTCLSGVEVLNVCSNLNRVRKTYWREGAAN
jgi:type IV pilus assembly protein PilY1